MATDLTAILVLKGEHDPASIRRAVATGRYGDVWLRVRPLEAVKLVQVELCDAGGLPCVDPALVHALSSERRRALFVHVNHDAKQAVVHAFHDGEQLDGWVGEPPDFDGKLTAALGRPLTLEQLLAADDGSRRGLGTAASGTVALVRGRTLAVPAGSPTMLGTFAFHDDGEDRGSSDEGQSDEEEQARSDRVALLAYDAEAVRRAWSTVPGAELAARIQALPRGAIGPLFPAVAPAVLALTALGDDPPGRAGDPLRSVPALELVALAEAYAHAGGGSARYLDERFLPLFTLSSAAPVFEDEDDDELEARPSVLAAMVEVLPFSSPGGSLLEQLGDEELSPLAPWAERGAEYVGSLFRLLGHRLRDLLRTVDERELAARVDAFYRSWWRGSFEGDADAFAAWRRGLDEKGAPDVERFLRTWANWRTVLELATANALQPALLFYGA